MIKKTILYNLIINLGVFLFLLKMFWRKSGGDIGLIFFHVIFTTIHLIVLGLIVAYSKNKDISYGLWGLLLSIMIEFIILKAVL